MAEMAEQALGQLDLRPRAKPVWLAVIIGCCVLSTIAGIATEGNVAVAIGPIAAVGMLYLLWNLPLRYSILGLYFFSIVSERKGDGHNHGSPLMPLGILFNNKLSSLTNIKPLYASGSDLLFLFVTLALIVRSGTHSKLDGPERLQVPSPRVLGRVNMLIVITAIVEFALGKAKHGDTSIGLLQLRQFVHIPFYFFVFQYGLRGPADFKAVGKAIVITACLRAALVLYLRKFFLFQHTLEELNSITNHDDSMTFALAMSMLIIQLNEAPNLRSLAALLIPMPLIVMGVITNHRRLAWVDTTMVLVAYALISPRSPLKKMIARVLILALPILVIYVGAGWNRATGVFGPVKIIRSVVDSKSDSSTRSRDVENYDIVTSMPGTPLLGRGLGQPYDEAVMLDDISQFFPEYKCLPHNNVLAICLFFGWAGFLGIWMILPVTLFLGVRAYKRAADPTLRTAIFAAVGMVVIFLNQAYGDMAYWSDIGPLHLGMAMAVIGKAAVYTQAWPPPPGHRQPGVEARLVRAEAA